MKTQTIIILVSAVAAAQAWRSFTALIIDHHPCRPDYLKNAVSYICDSDGNVRCINGWEKDPNESPITPCSRPICDPPCGPNGDCISPGTCACDVGWEGRNCSQCIDLPGCEHGSCENGGKKEALTCKCEDGYTGGHCDIPSCTPNCRNGICISSNRCQCYDGWKGAGCDTCVKHPGCVKGSCINPRGRVPVGDGCFCDSGFKGPLCDQLDCAPNDCVNGECQMLLDNSAECVCYTGWRGENCTECVAQPNDCSSGMCLDNVPWSCKAENSPGTMQDVFQLNFLDHNLSY